MKQFTFISILKRGNKIVEDKNFLKEIFNENEQKCTDLFGTEIWFGKLQDGSRNKMRVYVDYVKFVQEVLKLYKADVADFRGERYITPCAPSQLSQEEQQDVKEMLEAIIDTIHYAKFKRSKK